MSPFIESSSRISAAERKKVPWIIVDDDSVKGKFIRYLSGGGMNVFGRTFSQELARFKHRRFLIFSAVLGFVWLLFWAL